MLEQRRNAFAENARKDGSSETSRYPGIRAASVLLLCFASGTTDALSYLTLGNIFTSAMTGCAALLFLKLAAGQYTVVTPAATALGSYLLGCVLATLLQPKDKTLIGSPATLRRLLLGECALLFLYIPITLTGGGMGRTLLLIFLSATAMGMQSIVARDLREPGISTVVLNPTMTSLGIGITQLLMRREPALPRQDKLYIKVLVAYSAGALVAALGVAGRIEATNLLPFGAAAAVLLLFQYLCRRRPEPAFLRR